MVRVKIMEDKAAGLSGVEASRKLFFDYKKREAHTGRPVCLQQLQNTLERECFGK